ncbi:hypothetical protein K1719_008322 [Acacia pycnantha]|nr:hypothetical protein K1719_008322 [Acacia pycnantha]
MTSKIPCFPLARKKPKTSYSAQKLKISDPSPNLKMDVGAVYYPKPNCQNPLGEDSYFICSELNTVGVADGVGSWSEKGIDAGQYARELMQNACVSTLQQLKGSINSRTILNEAFRHTKSEGSSTACIATLKQTRGDNPNEQYYSLHAVNVGDSGFMLFRNLKIVFQSPTQQHGFNTPYQLGNGRKSDKPEKAREFTVEVAAGDIVVFGTDGLFDNLFPGQILSFIERNCGGNEKVTPERLSLLIAEGAKSNSYNKYSTTPFSKAYGRKAGIRLTGGKIDDITVLVAFIVPC